MRIEEVMKRYEGENGRYFTNGGRVDSLDAAIDDVASTGISFRRYDLIEWVRIDNNYAYVEEAYEEYGHADGFYADIAQGRVYKERLGIEEEWDKIKVYIVLDYMKRELGIEDISEKELRELERGVDGAMTYGDLYDLVRIN